MENSINKSGGMILSDNLIVRWEYDAEIGKVRMVLVENDKEIASVSGYTQSHIINKEK
jgi:hypothetical protein